MLSSHVLEPDFYFDSADSFDSILTTKDHLVFPNSDFDIWLTHPLQSVNDRRQTFLSQMGLPCKSDHIIVFDRVSEFDEVVSNSSSLSTYGEDGNLVCCDREMNSEANSMVDDAEFEDHVLDKPTLDCENMYSHSVQSDLECEHFNERKQKMKSWWKFFLGKKKHRASEVSKSEHGAMKPNRMKVKHNKKSCKEFTGVYTGQEIKAHNGYIWSLKFSPDGQYLATGGEDGVVRIWLVTSVDASHGSFAAERNFSSNLKEQKPSFSRKKISHASVIIPENIFQIEESPIHEFHGHASDILDLAWSNSNCLLSSSKDKTVRLWQVGYNHCINVFHHTDYVTCIQFNPIDENYFISGSIDGKVRIWGVTEKRVVDWVDARDVTSAICYEPDGKGFVVGSVTGTCRFYKASGNDLELEAEIYVGRKRSSGNGITGIQFSRDRPQRVMITSEDSKLRIFDGFDVVHKFKGLPKSGSQMSASFTSTGRHIVSVGEDCRVYVWDYDGMCIPSSKHAKSVRSCEHFFYEGVSAAVPWSGIATQTRGLNSCSLQSRTQTEDSASRRRLGNCFFMDGSCRGKSATWPEENLPRWDYHDGETIIEQESCHDQQCEQLDQHGCLSDAWGLVIVTAGFDGSIRTFHNYGLPLME
ncbi:Transducin/WD40 repeat-like superfamily protein [Euphorbia peplus]|nr:Transducin/WD40 repeat-like superfamily protein [Euphorbia peplus]